MSYCIGIDFASENIVVSVADPAIPYVPHPLRNELSNDTTPNIIGFQRNQYIIGENAQSILASRPSNTIKSLPYLITWTNKQLVELKSRESDIFSNVTSNSEIPLIFSIDNDNLFTELPIEIAVALILNKCHEISRNDTFPTGNDIAIAIPSNYGDKEIIIIQKAAILCKLDNIKFVNSAKSVAYFYGSRLYNSKGLIEGEKRTVLICDQGSHNTQLTLVTFNGNNMDVPIVQHKNIGSRNLDLLIYNYLLNRYSQLNNNEILNNDRKRQRILNACSKLKHLLSTLIKADYVLENVLDIDINISVTRDDIISSGTLFFDQLSEISQSILNYLNDNQLELSTIEFIGGGTRSPMIQEFFLNYFKSSASFTMDGSSVVSRGCVSILANHISKNENKFNILDPIIDTKPIDSIDQSLVDLYNGIVGRNIETHKLLDARNKLESYIIHIRDASHNKYKTQLPSNELDPLLSSYDDWIANNENATISDYDGKHAELTNIIVTKYPDYSKIMEQEKAALDEALKKASLERDNDNDDHDDRKLPKASRKRLVLKNKEEGNELFKDNNLEHATLRYIKALGHCDKFFDLGPEDEQEIKEIKISLYLNVSMCYIKLKKLDKALDNLSKSLVLDENNPKALYRQALCYYEKKMYSESKRSLAKAEKVAPEDAAVMKLQNQVQTALKLQLEKEKSMAKKMFG